MIEGNGPDRRGERGEAAGTVGSLGGAESQRYAQRDLRANKPCSRIGEGQVTGSRLPGPGS